MAIRHPEGLDRCFKLDVAAQTPASRNGFGHSLDPVVDPSVERSATGGALQPELTRQEPRILPERIRPTL